MVFALQVSVALIFFANKVFLLIGKKSGWLLGAIAAFTGIFYFFLIGLYIYIVLELGVMLLMAYGFWKRGKQSRFTEIMVRVVTTVVMLFLATFAFAGMITVVEFTSSVIFLFGTFFLLHGPIRIGWAMYFVAHVFSAYLGYTKEQDFFADFQVASAIVCFAGAIHKPKRND